MHLGSWAVIVDPLAGHQVVLIFLMAGIERLVDDGDADPFAGDPLGMDVPDAQAGVFAQLQNGLRVKPFGQFVRPNSAGAERKVVVIFHRAEIRIRNVHVAHIVAPNFIVSQALKGPFACVGRQLHGQGRQAGRDLSVIGEIGEVLGRLVFLRLGLFFFGRWCRGRAGRQQQQSCQHQAQQAVPTAFLVHSESLLYPFSL